MQLSLRLIIIPILICFIVYLIINKLTYFADIKSIDNYIQKYENATISKLDKTTLVFKGNYIKAALVFYPGGNVEYLAYKPLLVALASKGILCILFKMTLNIAFFNINAAKGIKEKFPEIKKWYIGGHSLGGLCASFYLHNNINEFKGLILFSSYTIKDFSGSNLKVISILGNEDKVINMERYNNSKKNLPKNFNEIIIDGGCHSYFGMYGLMKNDGIPKINNIEQIEYTANELNKLIS